MREDYAAEYAALYARHWWWRAREAILVREIGRLPLPRPAEILDVGCGDAVAFPALSQFGSVRGIEVDPTLVRADNPHRERVFHAPLGDPLYADWRFDLVTALDVVEHIENDELATSRLAEMVKPGGFLLVTVPAFMLLWDQHDERNRHFRRYRKGAVRRLLAPFGRLRTLRYLFHGLFFFKLAFKLVNRAGGGALRQHALPPAWLNRAMQSACLAEYYGLSWLRIPFGTSVLAVLERRPETAAARPAAALTA